MVNNTDATIDKHHTMWDHSYLNDISIVVQLHSDLSIANIVSTSIFIFVIL